MDKIAPKGAEKIRTKNSKDLNSKRNSIEEDEENTHKILGNKTGKELYESYNNKVHSEIGDTPYNVWHKGIPDTIHKTIEADKLEEAFMHEIVRKVNKDRTVNIDNKLYEAPSMYKLQKVTLRYYISNEEEIWIYENGDRKEKLKKLDKKENSEIKRKVIDYTRIVNDERDVVEYGEEIKTREYDVE